MKLLNLSSFSVLGHYKLSEALIYCWRNRQLDVSGCPAVHGPGDLPEHAVVCTTPDIPGFVFPLAGTGIGTFFFRICLNDEQAFCGGVVNLTLSCWFWFWGFS